MNWQGKTVGYAITGSHCTFEEVMPVISRFVAEGANVVPIISNSVLTTDTRFGTAQNWQKQLKDITGNDIISTIVEAEPLGPSSCSMCSSLLHAQGTRRASWLTR